MDWSFQNYFVGQGRAGRQALELPSWVSIQSNGCHYVISIYLSNTVLVSILATFVLSFLPYPGEGQESVAFFLAHGASAYVTCRWKDCWVGVTVRPRVLSRRGPGRRLDFILALWDVSSGVCLFWTDVWNLWKRSLSFLFSTAFHLSLVRLVWEREVQALKVTT